ncbi:TIGR02281 family clan AA aspartic protease [Novosphingobium sp. 9]|uniref:retropepsin-like aspartic protease family protein n=1 Tax=Novosphingobium sp. 9 TaxID=2025349 RepID=UPI0021B56E17|nr:TIGR02281 family clan AA aspartic protease [Novosphingobium sp. 9]
MNFSGFDLSGFHDLLPWLRGQPLLALALAAIFVSVLGGVLRRPLPWIAGLLRGIGTLGLVAALLLTVAQVARFSTSADISIPALGVPRQVVEGRVTRVPMSPDGHFWIRARVNGTPIRFLVDTGATITALSPRAAREAGVEVQPIRRAVMMQTANGTVSADMATIDEMHMGNIVARDLDAVIVPGLQDANVIGMNLLSRLAGWRVERNTLILEPHHPQTVTGA